MPSNESEEKLQTTTPSEGSDLNGDKASFRNAPLRSEGVVWPRMRLPNGATVPIPRRKV